LLEHYHVAFLGAGVINPLNLRLAGPELDHILRDSGVREAAGPPVEYRTPLPNHSGTTSTRSAERHVVACPAVSPRLLFRADGWSHDRGARMGELRGSDAPTLRRK